MTTEFAAAFKALTGHPPFRWQVRLFHDFCTGPIPSALDLPTGLGKTSVMAVWLIARALADDGVRNRIPRRLVYVVDRRAVVDQATEEAEKIRKRLGESGLDRARLGLADKSDLPISTLRGQLADNRDWLADPASAAIVVGTIDMIGSRLLFQGYGVSRGMRPMQAAFLCADTLIVLDEAHLVPPFEALLKTIALDSDHKLWPRVAQDAIPVPRLQLMSLSATGRASGKSEGAGAVFHLMPEEKEDPVVSDRLNAAKRMKLDDVGPGGLVKAMAERAWERGEGGRKVIVFCNSRKIARDIHGELAARLTKLLKADAGEILDRHLELIVGARRVRERERLAGSFVFRRFAGKLGEEERKEQAAAFANPAFLIATSAGEVGVDIDADHMVCDLVPWERMVQRLGRVNRRGDFTEGSLVDVFAVLPDKEAESRGGDRELDRWRAPFESTAWPEEKDGRRDASPAVLLRLRDDEAFRELCLKATTEPPLHPKLTRGHLDAWSMTSLKEHPGRAEVQPWLRGWVEDEPQTELIWRLYLPVRRDEGDGAAQAALNEFLEEAPPHISEILEDRTDAVAKWLETRAKSLLKPRRKEEAEQLPDAESGERLDPPQPDSVVAVVLTPRNEVDRLLRLHEIEELARRKQLYSLLANSRVILDARLGGLDSAGLLDAAADDLPPTLDGDPGAGGGWDQERLEAVGFRVRRLLHGTKEESGWKTGYSRLVNAEREESGELDVAYEWRVEVWRGEGPARGNTAISRQDQPLDEHIAQVVATVEKIAVNLDLNENYKRMLVWAARCHDSGKARTIWQRFAGNPLFARNPKKYPPLGKFSGRPKPALLRIGGETYRHEFGSLRDAIKNRSLNGITDKGLCELALHLVAAHHGHARPVIAPADPDAAPSASTRTAQEAASRFARLQQIWGPWGLAWWESLLRAADMLASRAHDRKAAPTEEATDGKTADRKREAA